MQDNNVCVSFRRRHDVEAVEGEDGSAGSEVKATVPALGDARLVVLLFRRRG